MTTSEQTLNLPSEDQHAQLIVAAKSIPHFQVGTGARHCLFVGPGQIYLPTIPSSVGKIMTLHDVDRYWTVPKSRPKAEQALIQAEFQAMSYDDLLAHYAAVLDSLVKQLELPADEKMVVMAPSALATAASHLGQHYSQHISHVIMLGAPVTTEKLLERGTSYLHANTESETHGDWRPIEKMSTTPETHKDCPSTETTPESFSTESSRAKWRQFNESQKAHQTLTQTTKLTPEEAYVQELKASEIKYWGQTQSEEVIASRWVYNEAPFNLDNRARFFSELIPGKTLQGHLTIPTLAITGWDDCLAPWYHIPEAMNPTDSTPPTLTGPIDVCVLPQGGHFSHEQPQFAAVLSEWFEERVPRLEEGSQADVLAEPWACLQSS